MRVYWYVSVLIQKHAGFPPDIWNDLLSNVVTDTHTVMSVCYKSFATNNLWEKMIKKINLHTKRLE